MDGRCGAVGAAVGVRVLPVPRVLYAGCWPLTQHGRRSGPCHLLGRRFESSAERETDGNGHDVRFSGSMVTVEGTYDLS